MTTNGSWKRFPRQPISRSNERPPSYLPRALLLRERSDAGRIRYEYFTFTLGLNPGPAVRPQCPLLFLDENVSEMGLGVAAGSYVIAQIRFARSQTILGQSSAKQLVAQPDAVCVHDVGLAIGRDFGYAPLATVPLDVRPADAVGLPGSPMTRHSSCSDALFWELKDDSTSQRSIASSL